MHKKVRDHFRSVDPVLSSHIEERKLRFSVTQTDPALYFESLVRSIVGQQLSGKAADSIFARVQTLFPKKTITAKEILTLTDEDLRSAGLSFSKIASLKALALAVEEKKLPVKKLHLLSQEEVFNHLIPIRGIGPWTIEMFSMFSLGNEDLFSYGDLGLQKGMQRLYKLRSLPTQKQMERISKKWSPYRTYGALALWNAADNR